jgi:hypothetical protein
MAWTNIANANLDVGAPIRSVDILALRDNITALANGDTGAPPIKAAALGSGQTGNAPIFAARAWVNFDGTNAFTPNPSTSAIRGSGNVSSVTKNATGDYTINFATALPNVNYSVAGIRSSVTGDGFGDGGGIQIVGGGYTQSTSSVRITNYAARSGNNVNTSYVNVIIFG